ncbi:MAG: hypothetical protein HC848_02045 [Limnobacter sp.]|nr:hypothetical protein [Limnobacter sp.]
MSSVRHYRVSYLHTGMLDATAQPEPKAPGYNRHELVIPASSRREAIMQAMDRGGVVTDVQQIKPTSTWSMFGKKGASRSYKHKFLQAVEFNVRSGLSPEKSLEQVVLGETGEHRITLNRALNALRQGFSFVEAIDSLSWFDESTLSVLKAGETSGSLSQALSTAVQFHEKGSATLRLMFGAVAWTVLDVFMAISTVIGMRFGLIEQLKQNPLTGTNPEKVAQFKLALAMAEQVNNLLLVLSFAFTVLVFYLVLMILSRRSESA